MDQAEHGRRLQLGEYETLSLPARMLSPQAGERLWRQLDQNGKRLVVAFPSPKTGNTWQLTAQGWVGQIRLPGELTLTITPKVPVSRLFQLWELAYDRQIAHLFKGMIAVDSVPAFFSLLAEILARLVLHRGQQGFQRAYLSRTADLPYMRGRLLPRQSNTGLPTGRLACCYSEQTTDIPDNQILVYTLHRIARSNQCSPAAQTAVRRAYHLLQPIATLRPFVAEDCLQRTYSRLNQDYALLHALCAFFLEQSGPQLDQGDRYFMPFLLNMPQLYERCVAKWLRENLPPPYRIKVQESTDIGPNAELRFQIDLTLYTKHGRPLAVLDTKYKVPQRPDTGDVSQVITYAKARGCRHAILIYPQPLPQPLQVPVGDVQLHTLSFELREPPDKAGKKFLDQLWARLHL